MSTVQHSPVVGCDSATARRRVARGAVMLGLTAARRRSGESRPHT